MEEDLGSKEAFVAHVNVEGGLGDCIDSLVLLDPLPRVGVILGELPHDVGTDVAVPLLDTRVKHAVSSGGNRRRQRAATEKHLDGFGGFQ